LADPQDGFWLLIPMLIVFFAGELVWGESEARLSEIADAAPAPDLVPFVGKLVGLSAVLVLLQALIMAAGMLVQVRMGYHLFEPGLYAQILFGFQLPDYLLFVVLAFTVHAIVNHKYVGHAVLLLVYGFSAFAAELGIEHKLLVYASIFAANTYWELAADQVTARQAGAGSWQVTLDVQARKVVIDSLGAETEIPMDDLVEVGVFAAAEDGGLGEPLYLRMHRVHSGEQRITVTVPRKPARAGIDPRSLLIDMEATDNLREIRSPDQGPLSGSAGSV